MIIERLLKKLPIYVDYEGATFHLEIFINATDEVRLCYSLYDVAEGSKYKQDFDNHGCWENPFYSQDGPHNCSFLFLAEGIQDDGDMIHAIDNAWEFLVKNSLMKW